jgi:hypothetical protein
MNKKNKEKVRFEKLFYEWKAIINTPQVLISSRPKDYIDNEPYREIVKMGSIVLPFIIDKIEQGEFLLNQAVFEIAEIKVEDISDKDNAFPSEQEKAAYVLRWWKERKKDNSGPQIKQ